MFNTSQDPAKYQKDAKYDHGFLQSWSVIGYLHSQRRVIQNKTTRHGDLAVHLLPGVCSVCLFCFLSGQSQLSRKPHHPMKCFLTFSSAGIMYSCCILLDPGWYTALIAKQIT